MFHYVPTTLKYQNTSNIKLSLSSYQNVDEVYFVSASTDNFGNGSYSVLPPRTPAYLGCAFLLIKRDQGQQKVQAG